MTASRPFTIAIALDGSASSMAAARYAIGLAARVQPARIHLLYALMPAQEAAMHDTSARPARAFDDSFLDRARDEAGRAGVEAGTKRLQGDPAEELLREAQALGADLLVIGRRGERAKWEGSLTARLLARAPCAVIVAR